jgi:transposase-like protein
MSTDTRTHPSTSSPARPGNPGAAPPPSAPVANQPSPPAHADDPTTLRRQHRELKQPLQDLDRRKREEQLRETTGILGRRDPRQLLDDAASTSGLSWSTIGRMLGVSPSAMRKWRRGGGAISPENREQIAMLSAFLTTVQSCKEPIADIGSWIEMRLRDDTTLTPADIYASGAEGRLLLIDLAAEVMTIVEVLDAFDENWRDRFARDAAFRVVDDGPGGERAIVQR